MSDSELSDIEIAANATIWTLIPTKSKAKYELEYEKFEDWYKKNKLQNLTEKVFLAYFAGKSKINKPSTLWTHYSMLRATINMKKNLDIGKYTQLIAFLKRQSEGHKPKKSKIFSKEDVHKFILTADDDHNLMIKVTT